ncbi:hypothetical protein KVR01_007763 [Diaporthe batatas]|uniref:uncharacterized protein n=1 Tax=Diaporthe batatas TaxID=748121 RepID=UPI001D05BDC3|nr:uncharacterized protein KVR01_007763 [Diaporthe batatas]KAG8161998.1 hypothetical protein KVR01_007763 [Diaporthe batatas]
MNHCGRAPGVSKVDRRRFEQVVEDMVRQVVEQATCTGGPLSPPPPRATVLFAGFPCQPFSNLGKRRGLDCEKNGHHLYGILKLLIYLRNPIVVLENVKPFAENKDFGAMEVVQEEFEELGYHVSHNVYNTVDFGLPQNRERLFIVAVRKDLATRPFRFEQAPSRGRGPPALTEFLDPPKRVWGRGHHKLHNGVIVNPYIPEHPKGVWIPKTMNGKETKFVSDPSTPGRAKGLRRLGDLGAEGLARYISNDIVYHHTGLAGAITTKMHNWYQVPHTGGRELIRRLSLGEGLRIQGVPEDVVLSESGYQARRQIGNSVAPPIAEWIVRCLQGQYQDIFDSEACSTTEVWPHVQAPKMSPEERQGMMQHMDRLESRRREGQERRKAQRALREEAERAAGFCDRDEEAGQDGRG